MVELDLGDGLRGKKYGAAEKGGAGEEFGVLEERVDGAEDGKGVGAEEDDAVVLHENNSRDGLVAVAPEDHFLLNLAGEGEAGVGVIDQEGGGPEGEDLIVDGAAIGELAGARGGGDLVDDDGMDVDGDTEGGIEGEETGEEGEVLVGLGAELRMQLGAGDVLREDGILGDDFVKAQDIEVNEIGGLEDGEVSAPAGDGDTGIGKSGGEGTFFGKDETAGMIAEGLAEGEDFCNDRVCHRAPD
jgi:hypothetical protein